MKQMSIAITCFLKVQKNKRSREQKLTESKGKKINKMEIFKKPINEMVLHEL